MLLRDARPDLQTNMNGRNIAQQKPLPKFNLLSSQYESEKDKSYDIESADPESMKVNNGRIKGLNVNSGRNSRVDASPLHAHTFPLKSEEYDKSRVDELQEKNDKDEEVE